MHALLNRQFLNDIGVKNMSDEQLALLSQHYETTLYDRVIDAIIVSLDEGKLAQLQDYQQRSDEELQSWLRENVDQLSDIIEDETTILLGELVENADKL